MNRYTAEEPNKIFAEIVPQRRLLVPSSSGPSLRASGPAVCIYLRYSEVVPGTDNVEGRYSEILRQTPVLGAVGVLASINSVLSEHRAADRDGTGSSTNGSSQVTS
jgi:hypothetical protein